jgi:hypothetical protein
MIGIRPSQLRCSKCEFSWLNVAFDDVSYEMKYCEEKLYCFLCIPKPVEIYDKIIDSSKIYSDESLWSSNWIPDGSCCACLGYMYEKYYHADEWTFNFHFRAYPSHKLCSQCYDDRVRSRYGPVYCECGFSDFVESFCI